PRTARSSSTSGSPPTTRTGSAWTASASRSRHDRRLALGDTVAHTVSTVGGPDVLNSTATTFLLGKRASGSGPRSGARGVSAVGCPPSPGNGWTHPSSEGDSHAGRSARRTAQPEGRGGRAHPQFQ